MTTHHPAAPSTQQPATTMTGSPAAPRILVIDPDPGTRRMLRLVLGVEGMAVAEAATAEAALEAVGPWQPTVVVLEPQFLGRLGGGVPVLAGLRQRDPSLPIVVYTTTLNPNVEALRLLGAAAVIIKGAQDLAMLLAAVWAAHTAASTHSPVFARSLSTRPHQPAGADRSSRRIALGSTPGRTSATPTAGRPRRQPGLPAAQRGAAGPAGPAGMQGSGP